MSKSSRVLSNLRYDIPASIVVFLVALPLCMGIAGASKAPGQLPGIIAGMVGGLIVGAISRSQVSVSGPAAGLTVIVASGIATLQSYPAFLAALVVAGLLQLLLGFIKAGVVSNFFPHSVIKGMLASIGLILILKQFEHFVGYDSDFEGDESFTHAESYGLVDNLKQMLKQNTFTDIYDAIIGLDLGATIVGVICLAVLAVLSIKALKKSRLFLFLPPPLIVVMLGIGINALFIRYFPSLSLQGEHLVKMPIPKNVGDLQAQIVFPDFSQMMSPQFWTVALTIAIIASIETLLSIDAGDKLDPYRRKTPRNRELMAQGMGNMVSGMLGGLPVTSVIVRTSANIASGARSQTSAIMHGVWLMAAIIFLPGVLNLIPKSALAAILLQVGFKLVKPSIFFDMFTKGWSQFIPFVVTVVAILFSDLLVGILIGMVVGIYFVVRTNYRTAIAITKDGQNYLIRFKKDVSFLNKISLSKVFDRIPDSSYVIIDIRKNLFVDHDIKESIEDFKAQAVHRDITIEIKYSQ